jgi:hypothetical protein
VKTALILFLTVFLCHFGHCADTSREVTKVSTKKRFDVSEEVKAFYRHLLESNARVKGQYESLTARIREENGTDFFAFDPQVMEGFPSESHWRVQTGFDSDERYLVIQPIGFGHARGSHNDGAIVSLFRVRTEGTTTYDDALAAAGAEPKLISNKITITFLGFQNFKVTDLKPAKE